MTLTLTVVENANDARRTTLLEVFPALSRT